MLFRSKDLLDVPEEVRSQLKFELLENAGDLIQAVLGVPFDLPGQARDSSDSGPRNTASSA